MTSVVPEPAYRLRVALRCGRRAGLWLLLMVGLLGTGVTTVLLPEALHWPLAVLCLLGGFGAGLAAVTSAVVGLVSVLGLIAPNSPAIGRFESWHGRPRRFDRLPGSRDRGVPPVGPKRTGRGPGAGMGASTSSDSHGRVIRKSRHRDEGV